MCLLGWTVACNPPPPARAPSLASIKKQLDARVAQDPNGALCRETVERFNAGSIEALTPRLNRRALVERGIALYRVPADRAALWRRDAEGIDELSRFHFPRGAQFYCLGTRTLAGDTVLVLRLRQGDQNFSHLLLRLGGDDPERPIDDYMVLSAGYWHSGLQMFFDGPEAKAFADVHREMLMGSFARRYGEIITRYDALPVEMKRTPIMAAHYVNAVMTVTPAGTEEADERFKSCVPLVDEAFEHPVTRAHWRLIFLARLKRAEQAIAEAERLAAAVGDPFVHELRAWIRARP